MTDTPAALPAPPAPPGAGLGATAVAGTITAATGAASHVDCLIDPESAVVCQIRGTWSASLIFEGTLNPSDATWPTIRANKVAADLLTTAPDANGLYVLYCAGFASVRVRATAFTSGSVTVTFRASPGAGVYLPGSSAGISDIFLGGGGAVTIADGAAVTLGALADAAIGDAAGTVNSHLRSVAKSLLSALAVTEANGANVVLGALADAAVADAAGTLNSHLRQLAKLLTDVWDATNHRLYVANSPGGFINATQGTSPWVVTDAATETVLGALADPAVGDANGSVNAHLRQVAKSLAAGVMALPPAGIASSGTIDATHPTFDVTLAGLGSVTAQVYVATAPDKGLFLQACNDGVNYSTVAGYDDWTQYEQLGPDFRLTPRNSGSNFYGGMITIPAGWRYLRFGSEGTITRGSYQITVWESAANDSLVKVSGGLVNTTAYYGAEMTGASTADGTCLVNCQGASTLVVQVTGTLTSGSISATAAYGLNFDAFANPLVGQFVNLDTGEVSPTITAVGTYLLDCAGYLQVNIIPAITGSVTIEASCDSGIRAAVFGSPTDTAVTGDNPGTLNAHLRGLDKILADVWDSGAHELKVSGGGGNRIVTGTFANLNDTVTIDTNGASVLMVDAVDNASYFGEGNYVGITTTIDGNPHAVLPFYALPNYTLTYGSIGFQSRFLIPCAGFGSVTFTQLSNPGGVSTLTLYLEAAPGYPDLPIRGNVTSGNGDDVVLGTLADAAVEDADGTVNAHLRGLNAALAAGINVGGYSDAVSGSVTRPANTSAYTAGDAVTDSVSAPNPISFANAVRTAAGSGFIIGATLIDSANQGTPFQGYLYLFKETPTATNDNIALAISDADLANCIGVVDFTDAALITNAAAGASGNTLIRGTLKDAAYPFKLASGTTLYGLLQANNAYSPVSGETLTAVLNMAFD